MYSVEIHTPITLNEHFSIMCYLLVKSLAVNAGFPSDWRVVFSVSRDSNLTPESPEFAWARHFPVEFQWVDQDLWDEMGYVGTGTQCIITEHSADVVIYMDADMVVRGSLAKLCARIAGSDAVFGWPAWFSGDAPFDEIFRAAGIESEVEFQLVLTDDGADFRSPSWPYYLNFGFIGVPRILANRMRKTFPRDQAFVQQHYGNYFSGQVALALNIARNGYRCEPIDERFNVGSDHPVALAHYENKLGRKMLPSAPAIEDPRVLHYCFPTPTLRKKRDMASWAALQAFIDRPGLAGSERDLQETLQQLNLTAPGDEYGRYLASIELAKVRTQLEAAEFQGLAGIEALANQVALDAKNQALLHATNNKLRQALNRQRRGFEAAIEAMRRSLSWRLTAPLRALYGLFRREAD